MLKDWEHGDQVLVIESKVITPLTVLNCGDIFTLHRTVGGTLILLETHFGVVATHSAIAKYLINLSKLSSKQKRTVLAVYGK